MEQRPPRPSFLKKQPKLYTTWDLPLFVDKNVWFLHWTEIQRKGKHRPLPGKLSSNTILVTNKIVCGRQEIRTHPLSIQISPLVDKHSFFLISTVRKDSRRASDQVWKIPITLAVISLGNIQSIFTNGWGYTSSKGYPIEIFMIILRLNSPFSSFGQRKKI